MYIQYVHIYGKYFSNSESSVLTVSCYIFNVFNCMFIYLCLYIFSSHKFYIHIILYTQYGNILIHTVCEFV